jgi:HPt (histidine-containing phosphotransfer) domain-containing protein
MRIHAHQDECRWGGAAMPLDPETVQVLCSLPSSKGTSLMSDLAGIFLADLPERRRLMGDALEAQDGRALARVAHLLKGSCSAIGALEMAEACAHLEVAGTAASWPSAAEALARLDALEAVVRADLAEFL